MDKQFFTRVISSIILALTVFWIIFFANPAIFVLAAILFSSLALWEFYKIVEKKYTAVYTTIGLLTSFLLFISSWKITLGFDYFIYILSLSLILLFLYQFIRKTNQNAALCLSLTLLGLIYITIPFLFLIKIRMLDYGVRLVAYFIFVTKATDIGAYLVGRKLGKHLLIPRISPKKSIEGFCGGIVFSVIAAYVGISYLPMFSLKDALPLGVVLGICAQFGDLAESVLKRDSGVKDSGKTIPGLGGVLDLVDSLLISLPFYYLFILFFTR